MSFAEQMERTIIDMPIGHVGAGDEDGASSTSMLIKEYINRGCFCKIFIVYTIKIRRVKI